MQKLQLSGVSLPANLFLGVRFAPLPKTSKLDRVVSNVDIFDFELSEENMKKLDALDEGKAGGISWNPVEAD